MRKNDVVTVTIEDFGVAGEGIGKVDGYTLFIKDAVIGDVVEAKIMKAKKNYGYARLMKIICPSPHRGCVLRTAVIFFYISNEGVSLLENAGHLGLPVPAKLKDVLGQLHGRAEDGKGDE